MKKNVKIIIGVLVCLLVIAVILFCVFFFGTESKTYYIIVTIPDGSLRGFLDTSWKVPFYVYLRVPFAKAPVGKLRFQPPVPVEKWEGVLDATSDGPCCFQTSIHEEHESEDCLYLDLYTPQHPKNNSLPVLVNIHGGGFMNGKRDKYSFGPEYLMEEEIVIASINYRVGPFGFLATGDNVVPGNNGLKDQVLALKWIQNNIKYFNGDPNKVTIMGQSAGGASVTFQLMTKLSKGLFRAAIAQSGTILCPWTYQQNPKDNAYALAKYLNTTLTKDAKSQELVDFLQNTTAVALRDALSRFPVPNDLQMLNGFTFAPVIEPEHEGAFMSESQYSAIKEGHMSRVPLMIGICSEELIFLAQNMEFYKEQQKYYDNNVTEMVNDNMRITDPKVLAEVGQKIRQLYTNTTMQAENSSLMKFYDDVTFNLPVITHAKLQSVYSDVYFYQFSFYGELGSRSPNIPGLGRVSHGNDNYYIWVQNDKPDLGTLPPRDIRASERLRTLLKNFAKYLNPTPEKSSLLGNLTWPKMTPDNLQYLNINETLSIEKNPKGVNIEKWTELYEQYAQKPFYTF